MFLALWPRKSPKITNRCFLLFQFRFIKLDAVKWKMRLLLLVGASTLLCSVKLFLVRFSSESHSSQNRLLLSAGFFSRWRHFRLRQLLDAMPSGCKARRRPSVPLPTLWTYSPSRSPRWSGRALLSMTAANAYKLCRNTLPRKVTSSAREFCP